MGLNNLQLKNEMTSKVVKYLVKKLHRRTQVAKKRWGGGNLALSLGEQRWVKAAQFTYAHAVTTI